jgi:Bacterial SH3 domain
MVSRPRQTIHGVALASLVLLAGTGVLRAQQVPRVTVGVRPTRVRVGDTFVITIRVAGATWPDGLDLAPGDGAALVDFRDRTSTGLGAKGRVDHVLERDFVMRAVAAGPVAPGSAVVIFGRDTMRTTLPEVTATAAAVSWGGGTTAKDRRAPEVEPSAQGVPPTAVGRDADRERAPQGLVPPPYRGVPWDLSGPGGRPRSGGGYALHDSARGGAYVPLLPYGAYGPDSAYGLYGRPGQMPGAPYSPYSPYAPSGHGPAPVGRDWAATAAGDPWWPELVPQLDRYQVQREDPTGVVRLEAGLTPARVYVGQQITLVASATFLPEALARLGRDPEFFPPSAGGAWSVEIPWAAPTAAAVRGRTGEAHTFMRAFFPVTAGLLEVEGARLAYALGDGTPGRGQADTLVTAPLSVEVLPIPARSAPPGWGGAVGRYRVAAWVQPSSVGWGEAALLTVEVSGAGNVRPLPRPDPGRLSGAELRPAGERAVVEVRDGVVGGVKTFTWLVVPVEAGPVRIGPVILPYFDPWLGAFAQAASDEVVLETRPLGAPSPAPSRRGAAGVVPDTSGLPVAVSARLDTEAEAEGLLRRIGESSDAGTWLDLGSAYGRARPGEGWAAWAWASGRARAPRDARLRAALESAPGWKDPIEGGLPHLLSPAEAEAVAGLLGLLAVVGGARGLLSGRPAAVAGAGVLRRWRPHRLALAGAALGGALTVATWAHGAPLAVAVGGPLDLRTEPTWTSETTAHLAAGSPLRVEARYRDWVRVRGAPDVVGWTPAEDVATLAR